MRHSREEVVARTEREFAALDAVVARLSDDEWKRPVPRPETKDPWTVKDSLVHITYWKADVARFARGTARRAVEVRHLSTNDHNRWVYERWRDRAPAEVLAWHRSVHEDVLVALHEAPETWFSGRDRKPWWPFGRDGHLTKHRMKDIEAALSKTQPTTSRRSRA